MKDEEVEQLILNLVAEARSSLKLAKKASDIANNWQKAYETSTEQFNKLANLHKDLLKERDNYRVAAHAAIKAAENWRDKCETANMTIAEFQKVRLS